MRETLLFEECEDSIIASNPNTKEALEGDINLKMEKNQNRMSRSRGSERRVTVDEIDCVKGTEESGKSRLSLPSSGTIFEGELRSGRIDGFGTFIGSHGVTYRGFWSHDRKHGYGKKLYPNGSWRRNLQDGEGRYVWMNRKECIGHWRNGVILGPGVLTCANGVRYEGQFDDSFSKSSSSSETDRSFSKICVWESDGEHGDITCDIVDTVIDSMSLRRLDCLELGHYMRDHCSFNSNDLRKPGELVAKGHRNYYMMISLQVGIMYSVMKHSSRRRELRPSDFDPNEKFWTRFPSEGSKNTLPHQSVEFRWKDYCPFVFRHLRELFQVHTLDYTGAICENPHRELSSPGKSGSLFYLTQDDRFMIKTVKKSEVKVLNRMLSAYHKHVSSHPNSLLTKFFGMHCVKPAGGQKMRFIVMGNLFYSEHRIHTRFDLKGSSHGRATDRNGCVIGETMTLKDLDLNFVFWLPKSLFNQFITQIDLDCEFLERERIMDYSLLIGLHFRDNHTSPFLFRSGKKDATRCEKFTGDLDKSFSGRKQIMRLGANMVAKAERISRNEKKNDEYGGEIYAVVLYFGIIDILQDYDITKKLEHAYKSLQANPTSISAVDPKLYSKRFRQFIGTIFLQDPNEELC